MITPLVKLREELAKSKLDAILISSFANILYLTNYCGFSKEEREAYLFITKNQQYILTDGRYTQAVKTLIPDFKLVEIPSKNSVEKILKNLANKHQIKRLGFEGSNLTFLEHKTFKKYFNNIYHLSISNLRSIKAPDEIAKIAKACDLGDETFKFILGKIKKGVSEKEIVFEIEFFIKKHGADISFPTIVAFGTNSATPHHQITNNKLTNNQIVLLDFGLKLNNYCSDMSRTIFFGSANAELKKIYNTVLEAQSRAIETLNILITQSPNVQAAKIDKIARDYIISKGYETIPHSVGHGIGIDVHEAPHLSPKSKDILKEGMVFSIEPGIYLPNFGGVRIEDLVVLEKGKPRLLTHSPKYIIEI